MNIDKQYKYTCIVEFEDCDPQKIVHHPKFFYYLERARLDLFNSENYTYKNMLDENIGFVITDMKTKFIKPAFFGDKLTIVSSIIGTYAHCIKINQTIIKGDVEIPIENWLSNPNLVMSCSIRFSIVNITNNQPIENNDFINNMKKKLNIIKCENIKNVHFKHPFS
jgi:YbgC/YbaW family acyl-CoA thioester hydrolase